ncbi:Swt1 family HEPN domain-containing protein [Flavobacterium aestivum]|uniref:Swt1 family HEPN domain-containing protein n=1 Tax=Flavobacterium aestivum TaxID=3003257 RepID=UPI002482CE2D|nr:Swt1 family HEPN domain-containing protein [Flavobacterium aestivum]
MTEKPNIREWLFRALMFEAESEIFKSAGIRVGADAEAVEKSLMEETLRPFSVQTRNEALKMARIYALINCFENSVRDLIKERLKEQFNTDWWEKGIPKSTREFAQKRQQDAQDNSWLEGDNSELIEFTQFGHLADIITQNWNDFSDLIPSQHWIKQRFDELEKARNYIAHNRLLLPSEFRRIEQYVNDWDKQVGF